MKRRDAIVGIAGVVVGAITIVGVYEGKVALSNGEGSVQLTAGQRGRADGKGVHGPDVLDANGSDDPLLAANANLADTVRDYKRRLESVDDQKKRLERQLAVAEHRLAIETDGAGALPKSEYDLSQDDWKDLAKNGRVKLRLPCAARYLADPSEPVGLGLAPDDLKLVRDAHIRSNERMWEQLVRPLCQQLINNATVVDRLGMTTCLQTLMESMAAADVKESVRHVAEIRAGLRPQPGRNDPQNGVEKMLLGLTNETKAFESDLARSLGPDEARRITYYDDKCMGGMEF